MPEMKKCRVCLTEKTPDQFEGTRRLCRDCRRAQVRQYFADNLEKHREDARAYYRANAERVREQHKRRHAENPNKYRSQAKTYRKPRLDVLAAQKRQLRLDNPDHERSLNKKRYKKSPAQFRAYCHRRRALLANAGPSFTAQEWLDCKASHDNRCVMCGAAESLFKLTPDHVVPLSRGGAGGIENIQPLCGPCNSSKNSKVIDLRKKSVARSTFKGESLNGTAYV